MTDKLNIVLDSTILNTVVSCGYKALLRHENHLERIGPGSETLEKGLLMHEFQEKYNSARFKRVPRIEAVEYASDNVTVETLENYKESDVRDYEIIREKFIDYTKNDPKHREWTITDEPEKAHSKLLYEDEDIKVIYVSKIDVKIKSKDGNSIPVDYKTESRRSDPDPKSHQFIGYCWNCDVNHMLVAKIGLQKTLPPAEKYRLYTLSYTDEQINEWKREVVYYARLLASYYITEYWPKNRTSCFKFNRMCAFAPICEATPDDRQRIISIHYNEAKPWNPLENRND